MFQSMYEVKISGKDIKRFIKKLYANKIFIYEIEMYDKLAYLKLDKENYNKLLNIKTIYEIEVVKLYGVIKVIDLLKRHIIFFSCLIIGFLYFMLLSNIIFEVDVIHSKKDIRELLSNELNYYGIRKYSFIKSYDEKEKIENKILNNHKDKIEWLEIERIGVKYEVRVEERIIKNPKEKKTPRNIIAGKDGIIMKIEASTGEIRKKIGDYVKKGDVIISGLITKNDEVKNMVAAEGIVYAETWYKTSINMPYYYNEINYLGDKRKVLKLKFLNKDFYFFPLKKFNSFKEKDIFALKSNLLPICIGIYEEEKTKEIEKIYTVEEAIEEARNISSKKIKSKIDKEEKIIKENVLSVKEYENYVKVDIFYKVYENIGIEEEINYDLDNKTD